jgi:putative membrane protein PagO
LNPKPFDEFEGLQGKSTMTARQISGFIALSLIWGSTWAAIRIVVEHVPPLLSVAIRFILAFVVMLPVLLVLRPRLPKGREWGIIAALSLVMIVLPFGLIALAEQRISSGSTAILFATSPLFTAWMEPRLGSLSQRRPVSRATHVALWAGLAGVLLVLSGAITFTESQIIGALLVLGVAILGAATTTLAKSELERMPLLTVTIVQFLIASAVLGLMSLLLERGHTVTWTRPTVLAMLFLGVVSSALGFLLFYWLLGELRPYQVNARQLLMPVVAIAEGTMLLHEPLPWTTVAGTAVVLGSLVIAMRTEA